MYKITFMDGTTFDGGEIQEGNWNKMPNKPIKKLECYINKSKIIMENYEAYNYVYEVSNIMSRGSFISKLILVGKKGKDVMIKGYDFIEGEFFEEVNVFGQEYYNKPLTGWKKGILDAEPKCEIK